jgi:ElaB/YqjD/DUF883 family membrane-anchored ribosome-binding protein
VGHRGQIRDKGGPMEASVDNRQDAFARESQNAISYKEHVMAQPTVDVTKDKLIEDFNAVVSDTEQLLKAVAATGGEKAASLRGSVEHNLKVARERLQALEQAAEEKARATARATDEYVHGHPWQSIGIAAGIGAMLGVVVGLLLNRR